MTDAHAAPDLEFVLACVRDDAAAGRLADWGASTVIDEHTAVPSFERDIFDALHAAAGIDAAFPVGNAGLLHVYGYWFSEVPTPFGFKRDRWQNGELARALGQRGTAFHLMRGSTSGDPGSTPLQRITEAALPLLLRPPERSRIGEALLDERRSRVVLVPAADAEAPALIYGIAPEPGTRDRSPLLLITAFPFGGDQAALIADFQAHPAPRWNAVADS
ncbi:amino acid deaminase [Leucobacter sp. NPDC077196]|uniref:amino acid deaminase n=1 Tax=Leucobacter sp. NPDC077196 TaxID=3154959 RepID=UPI00343234B2